MVREIAAAVPPEELGRAGHRFATQIDNVHLWAVAELPARGPQGARGRGHARSRRPTSRRSQPVFDFWERASGAYRFDDGTHQAWDADGVATPYRARVDAIVSSCSSVGDASGRARISRLNALLTSYLFLLWFDTRSGYQDTGPYALPDGRALLLRSFGRLGPSHFPWSGDVAAGMPYTDLLGAFVLDGVRLRVTDFGTSVTDPEDYLAHVTRLRAVRRGVGGAGPPSTRAEWERDRGGREVRTARAVSPHRGDGPAGEDRRRRIRLLHVPPPVRPARRRRPRLDRAP
ncbi:MAG: hypothetical protein KatS3mg010_1342 [Acidimicrobiia bacterium]|nr:MAG: hypothetical protein KatS3mg010_1342 [Acidimicrobiia bacterium]